MSEKKLLHILIILSIVAAVSIFAMWLQISALTREVESLKFEAGQLQS
jgi:hypothetical protein